MRAEDRTVVRLSLLRFLERLQARFRRRARGRWRTYLRRHPPCASCAFNPSTNGMQGMDSTANHLREALAEGRPFFCHVGFPWRTPFLEWTPETQRRYLREARYCSGWLTIHESDGARKDFERGMQDALRETGWKPQARTP